MPLRDTLPRSICPATDEQILREVVFPKRLSLTDVIHSIKTIESDGFVLQNEREGIDICIMINKSYGIEGPLGRIRIDRK